MLLRRLARITAAALVTLAAASASAQGESRPSEITPADVAWKDDPRAPGLQMAVLSGDPKQAGPYVVRVRMPKGAKLPPHTHPDVRYTTILSGEVLFGFGQEFDAARMKAYPAGSLLVIPANTPHYVWSKSGEVVTQDSGNGPTGSTPVGASAAPK